MIDIKKVTDEVYIVEALLPQVVPNKYVVYFIREAQGVVIDPGPGILIPKITEAMQSLGIKHLAYIIPTHIHMDHGGASGRLAQLHAEAKVLVHPAGKKHALDPSRLIESTKTVFGPDFEAVLGAILPVPESQIMVPEDGEVIKVGDRELQIIYSPGHAPHHMAIFDRSVQGLFCGEALGLASGGSKPLVLPAVAPPAFDQELYLESMEKLRKLKARLLFYSHGGTGWEPDELIMQAEESTRWLGNAIIKALQDGESTDAIARMVKETARSRFGIELSDMDVSMTVGGYAAYFAKMGRA
jgi:glyoxylase-like metal-dependent hydrolase (beta-lactamase superfamily II)